MSLPRATLTKSQVNKAGRTIRKSIENPLSLDGEKFADAVAVLHRYRALHQYPLTKANNGLRSMLRTAECGVEVTQRLKRVPTIVGKLLREPTMQLGSMQDIAGCRAVLDSIEEIRRVERRLRKNRPPVDVDDYIESPRASGYRGLHVIVDYDGRLIEIQLRTRYMHEWAIAVERLGGRLREDLKSGLGPEPVLDLLAAISEAMALEEVGTAVDGRLQRRIDRLRHDASGWLRGGGQ